MHIAEGALSGSPEGLAVLAVGWATTVVGTGIGLRRMDYERVPQVALLSATFFVVSLIPIPLGVTSAHLVLCGLMGLILGWAAFPAVLVALILQSLIAGIGGPTTLGINTTVMAVPAVACYGLFRRAIHARSETMTFAAAFAAGAMAVLLGALLNALALVLAGEGYEVFAGTSLVAHLLIAPVEGLITAVTVVFLRKVRPELLDAPLLTTRKRVGTKPGLEAGEVQPEGLDDPAKERIPC
jgi:cobalt/nickel transport system permease protein